MTKSMWQLWLGTCLLMGGLVGGAQAEVEQADRDLVKAVSERLLAAVKAPPAQMSWPPDIRIIEDTEELKVGRYNAYATLKRDAHKKPVIDKESGKVIPIVRVTPGLMEDVIQGDADRLAYVLGHELAHHLLGHTWTSKEARTQLEHEIDNLREGELMAGILVFTRSQELAADIEGLKLAEAAGYSAPRALKAVRRMIDLGLNFSSFEGLGHNHPSWADRLALMDRSHRVLWEAMAAYHDGSFFLLAEQYANAEKCFRHVSREFPDCYEAWASLGYALLMQYCDGLEARDLRVLDIGLIAVGGFYQRPESLQEKGRGFNEPLWKEAVEALKKALELKPDLVLARANLGVAYLVQPGGKNVAEAVRLLQSAADEGAADASLPPLARASVLVNTGVAQLAANQLEASLNLFRDGFRIRPGRGARLAEREAHETLDGAVLYDLALLLEKTDRTAPQRKALELYEKYLSLVSPASTWGELAFERYTALCKKLDQEPKTRKDLTHETALRFRPLTSVRLKSGVTLQLGGRTDALPALKEGRTVPVLKQVHLVRRSYPEEGVELLTTDRIVAIRLNSPAAPPLVLRERGSGGETRELRVGMTTDQLQTLLANQLVQSRADLSQLDSRWYSYPKMGLVIRTVKDEVEEMTFAVASR
jgi:tetratricopeptide (TPR) repeat protein